ncbi:MAG: hypothetical protein M3222_02360 [Thermoproteota archaeon]|nr:hypothetical protein [Thermoproteota archaeon]
MNPADLKLYELSTESTPILDIEDYNDMIPDEVNMLYDRLLKYFTDR